MANRKSPSAGAQRSGRNRRTERVDQARDAMSRLRNMSGGIGMQFGKLLERGRGQCGHRRPTTMSKVEEAVERGGLLPFGRGRFGRGGALPAPYGSLNISVPTMGELMQFTHRINHGPDQQRQREQHKRQKANRGREAAGEASGHPGAYYRRGSGDTISIGSSRLLPTRWVDILNYIIGIMRSFNKGR